MHLESESILNLVEIQQHNDQNWETECYPLDEFLYEDQKKTQAELLAGWFLNGKSKEDCWEMWYDFYTGANSDGKRLPEARGESWLSWKRMRLELLNV